MEINQHDVGVLLTPEIVGKTLYSHSEARKGRLVKLVITEVGYTHATYQIEDGESGTFATGNQGKGGKNWEAISFSVAKLVALEYLTAVAHKLEEDLLVTKGNLNQVLLTYPTLVDHFSEDPDPTVTISPSSTMKDGKFDEFFDKRLPPEGFVYPKEGDRAVLLANYNTSATRKLVIPAGAIGIVTCIRLPGTYEQERGYIGCGIKFAEAVSAYPIGGMIIPWDLMAYFKFFNE